MTLTDIARQVRIFEKAGHKIARPSHANPYIFWGDYLMEVHGIARLEFPRLTADDLAATDWDFLKE